MTEAFLILLLILILINGFLSMAEAALISSSKIKLENQATEGDGKAQKALDLANAPQKFIITVRTCVTFIAIICGVAGHSALAENLQPFIDKHELLASYSVPLSYFIIVFLIAFLLLVFGEFVPKRLALLFPEALLKKISGFIRIFTGLVSPLVWPLHKSSDAILNIFGLKKEIDKPVTVSDEEITAMIEKGTESGSFEEVEQDIVERLFFLSDRNVGSLMTSKTDLILLDINDEEDLRKKLTENQFTNYPVFENEIDNIIGVLNSKKVLSKLLAGGKTDFRSLLSQALFIHDKLDALKLLEQFKKNQSEFAVVVDEFGSFSGIVTLNDLFQALVGEVSNPHDAQAEIIQREDNTYLVDGLISFDEFLRFFDMTDETIHKENDFYTLSGFVMYITRHIPKTGEKFDWNGYDFEVIDMDGLRVDKVLVAKQPPVEEANEEKE